jgi:hypothetical protein
MGELPGRVAADTRAWRGESDQVLGYIGERLVFELRCHVMGTDLLADLNEWLVSRGHRPWSDKTLAARFGDHDEVARHRVEHGRARVGDEGLSRPPGRWMPGDPFVTPGPGDAIPERFRAWKGVRFRDKKDDQGPGDKRDDAASGTGGTADPVSSVSPTRERLREQPSHPSREPWRRCVQGNCQAFERCIAPEACQA